MGTLGALTQHGSEARIIVRCPDIVPEIQLGSSVCTNGVCLTATRITDTGFEADLSGETLSRSALKDVRVGGPLNLEPSLRVGDEVGGHFVFGHVDGVGSVRALERVGESWELTVTYPRSLAIYIAEKGSVSVDGISLTVARLTDETFTVAVVPFTYEHTILQHRRPGDGVNLEVDMLARYVARVLQAAPGAEPDGLPDGLTVGFLQEHGFMRHSD